MRRVLMSIIISCCCICLSSCAARKEILSCNTGEGKEWNYNLEFKVYSDFDKPYLESTTISTKFSDEKAAENFVNKYGLITNEFGTSKVTKIGDEYIVNIEKKTQAKYATMGEYKEMRKTINKKGEVCK